MILPSASATKVFRHYGALQNVIIIIVIIPILLHGHRDPESSCDVAYVEI